jgi:integrase
MIKAGENLAWIRDMIGHSDLKQLAERYGNWMNKKVGRRGHKFNKKIGN